MEIWDRQLQHSKQSPQTAEQWDMKLMPNNHAKLVTLSGANIVHITGTFNIQDARKYLLV